MDDSDEVERRVRDAERLVRIEDGICAIKGSVTALTTSFNKHIRDEHKIIEKVDAIESEMDRMHGGYRVFLQMCGALVIITGGIVGFIKWFSP